MNDKKKVVEEKEQKDYFVRNALITGGIILILLLIFFWGLSSILPKLCTVGSERVVTTIARDESCITTGAQVQSSETEAIVRFVDGWDSNGKVLRKGSTINGPAIVKEDPNNAYVIAVYPNASYTLKVDAVVWLYEANPQGLESQFQFFDKIVETIKP